MVFKGNPSISGQRLALELGLSGGALKGARPCPEPFHLQAMTYTMMDAHGRHSSDKVDSDVVQAQSGQLGSGVWSSSGVSSLAPFILPLSPDFFDLSQDRVWSTSAFATFKPHVLSKQAAGEGG